MKTGDVVVYDFILLKGVTEIGVVRDGYPNESHRHINGYIRLVSGGWTRLDSDYIKTLHTEWTSWYYQKEIEIAKKI